MLQANDLSVESNTVNDMRLWGVVVAVQYVLCCSIVLAVTHRYASRSVVLCGKLYRSWHRKRLVCL